MAVGNLLLLLTSILIYFDLAGGVLRSLELSPRAALGLLALLAAGGLVEVPLRSNPSLSLNLGGAAVPVAVVVYLVLTAGRPAERRRSVLGILVTVGAVYALGRVFRSDPVEANLLGESYLPALLAGLLATLAARSARGAVAAAMAGVVANDLAEVTSTLGPQAPPFPVLVGGSASFDGVVLAAVLSVLAVRALGQNEA